MSTKIPQNACCRQHKNRSTKTWLSSRTPGLLVSFPPPTWTPNLIDTKTSTGYESDTNCELKWTSNVRSEFTDSFQDCEQFIFRKQQKCQLEKLSNKRWSGVSLHRSFPLYSLLFCQSSIGFPLAQIEKGQWETQSSSFLWKNRNSWSQKPVV